MRWRLGGSIALGLLGLSACDDGGDGLNDAAPPPLPDAAPPPAPPPDLTGLYRVRAQRIGGDCPAELRRGPEATRTLMIHPQSTDETVSWRAIAGDRADGGFVATGTGDDGECGPPEETWAMTVSANGRAFNGTLTQAFSGCPAGPCTAQWEARAERAGGRRDTAYATLALDPADVAVLAAETWRDATWWGTAAKDGARIWRMTHDAGVPFLEVEISNGFKSIDPNLAGNDFAISSMARSADRLVVGTWDADAATLAERGLDLPPGDGFGLWARTDDGWTAITTDGFGDPRRTAATALVFDGDDLYVGTRNPGASGQVWRVADQPELLFEAPDCDAVSDLLMHGGALYAALDGCPDGAQVHRVDADGTTSLGTVGAQAAALVGLNETLYALSSDPAGAELRRHVGGAQWVVEGASGFAEVNGRAAGRGLRVHDADLLIFPAGRAAWLSKGGRALRDLTRVAKTEADISIAVPFERRLYLATRGDDALDPTTFADAAPAQLLRADSLLSETGGTTMRTLRDRVFDGARDADKACPRDGVWFNPALEHDQALRVALPPDVAPDDIVRLPAVYVMHPSGPPAEAAAFNAEAERVMHGAASCLYGRPGTIPCMPGEPDGDCLARCLSERVEGADGVALVADLGLDTVTLPVIERIALVFAGFGSGVYADADVAERWRTPDAIGQVEAAIPAVAEFVERCWPLSIRGPEARAVYGFDQGGHAAASAVGAGVFVAGVAHAPQLDRDRLIAAHPAWAAARAIAPDGALAFVVSADTCEARAATCSAAPLCDARAAAGSAGQVIVTAAGGAWAERLPGVVQALLWLDAALAGEASDPPDCGALPDAACAEVPAICE